MTVTLIELNRDFLWDKIENIAINEKTNDKYTVFRFGKRDNYKFRLKLI